MHIHHHKKFPQFVLALLVVLVPAAAVAASGHHGQVRFGQVPVPGVVVKAVQGDKISQTTTDVDGNYVFSELAEGTWTFQTTMPGFEPATQEIAITKEDVPLQWNLKMLPLVSVQGKPAESFPRNSFEPPALQLALPSADTVDRLLINGSIVNGASTPFALQRAFGNVRQPRSPYRGTMSFNGNNALFDARSFSIAGQNTPKPDYSRLQGSIAVNGPLQIPHVFRMGQFTASYRRMQNRNAGIQTAQMPTAAERLGDFSSSLIAPLDPVSGNPFAGGVIPQDRISPQARALVVLYPLPNFSGSSRFNYQVPVVGVTHGDNFQGSITNIRWGRTNQFSGSGAYSRTHSDNPDMFGFSDRVRASSSSIGVNWVHRFTARISGTFRYAFSRSVARTLPWFGNRLDISGDAEITGNDRDPRNWGPPALNFAGGIARLSSGSFAFNRDNSQSFSYTSTWIYHRHNFGYGAEIRTQQYNLLSQQNARGSFTFTGSLTGNDFADFLLGIPAASSLALGNPDKYFRQSSSSVYLTDDFRIVSSVTVNAGVRWEYESPVTEKYGRLVNLQIAPDFTSAAPVIAGNAHEALVHPDRRGFQPRIGLAWRPRAASSMVIRAGYGIYRDTNVYRAIADQMAQQAPLSRSLSVQNTADNPLTLADGFHGSPSLTAATFAIDPYFKAGNAQNWNLSVQQDFPSAMQMTVTYLGIKGTHVSQRMLPNTFPEGTVNPCPVCPTGFVYLSSNGNTSRNAGTIEVRRRQKSGFEASVQYTFSKAIDDAGLGGTHIAQNWLDLRAERGPSDFDQRHQATVQAQYTSGMLARLGSFWDGWRGKLLRQWTLTSQWNIGSGLPLTPTILAPVSGTGMTGILRPDVTGAPLYLSSVEGHLNPAAFASPLPGHWGNAGRNTIRGPGQFSLNASLTRSFRFSERVSVDIRIDATNVLNHVTFPDWNTLVTSSQFGFPTRANAMRSLQPSMRLRF